jgi:Putative 2OG-Fe(II) oxygenase
MMDDPQQLCQRALSHRDAQEMAMAYTAIEQAARTAPLDARIAFIRAQIALETGRPSAALFAMAQKFDPDNLMLARNHALSLANAGRVGDATALLADLLSKQPEWLDGHKALANLMRAADSNAAFDRSYAAACRAAPHSLALRLAWFHMVSLTRDWEKATRIIEDGARLIGERAAFALARIFIASESGAAAKNTSLFDAVADVRDAGLDLCQTRFWLRLGEAKRAEAIAVRHIGAPTAPVFWPYLSTAWRLSDDPKAAWLDDSAQHIKSYDLEFAAGELDLLAQVLRGLHDRKAHFLEQSVRGGTQTDGQLFFHHNPVIQAVRAKVTQCVADYIGALPPIIADHPLLGVPRGGDVLFAGSWSVRLGAQGHHSVHTHPQGWISSALYVSLPSTEDLGAKPAGWLSFGSPPPELSLSLPPYHAVEPIPGRLVLFPSTMWHETVPFSDGERLSIAFDVRGHG